MVLVNYSICSVLKGLAARIARVAGRLAIPIFSLYVIIEEHNRPYTTY